MNITEVTPEKLKELTEELEKNKIKYIVIAGLGLDGKRGYLTRPHQDVDMLCLKKDKEKVEGVYKKLKYYIKENNNDKYQLRRADGSKIDLVYLTIEGKEAVSYGSIAITRFPKQLFEKSQLGKIEDVNFKIAPNELLATWGKDSQKGNDAEYSKTLPVNENLIKKIKRVLRKEN